MPPNTSDIRPLYSLNYDSIYSRLSYPLMLKKFSYNVRLIEFIKFGRLEYDPSTDDFLLKKGILERINTSSSAYFRICTAKLERLSQETFILGEIKKSHGLPSSKVIEILLEEEDGEFSCKDIFSKADFSYLEVKTTNIVGIAALKVLLDSLCQNFSFLKRKMKAGNSINAPRVDSLFYIDWKCCLSLIKEMKLVSLCMEMHGAPSARIIKNLLEKGMMEEKIISKTLLMTGKDVRERLYLMLEDSLVQLQEVPRTAAADHAPSRTLYLWTVASSRRLPLSLRRNYQIYLHNLLLKRKDELLKNSSLLLKCSRTDVIQDPSLLNIQEQEDIETLNRRLYSIDQSLMDISISFNIWSSNKV